jgi:hypothetical protein
LEAVKHIVVAEDLRSGVEPGKSLGRADPQVAQVVAQDPDNGIVRQAILLGVVVGKFTRLRIETEQPGKRGDPNTGAI